MNIIYADNNATTKTAPEVVAAMTPFFEEIYYNPSSMYEPARAAACAISAARNQIASCFGLEDSSQVLFTSCATESNNAAIFGAAKANEQRKHIITTAVEHPAVLGVCKELERLGWRVTYLPVNTSGELFLSDFIQALCPDTLLVSIMHANNETGVMFPIEKLARITKETDPSILFHTDATQSAGKLPLNLEADLKNVDLLSFSGHKLHAPKGIGALFVRRGTPLRPFMIGGHQENSRRAGTENVPYIVGIAKALKLSCEQQEQEAQEIALLRNYLENSLKDKISYMQINGENAPRLPNTSNISCHYIEGEAMLYQLSAHGICASSGSACTSGSLEPSHVLRALNVPFTAIHGSIRFSLSRYNTKQEIETIVEVFPQIVASLRRISPYWDNTTNSPR